MPERMRAHKSLRSSVSGSRPRLVEIMSQNYKLVTQIIQRNNELARRLTAARHRTLSQMNLTALIARQPVTRLRDWVRTHPGPGLVAMGTRARALGPVCPLRPHAGDCRDRRIQDFAFCYDSDQWDCNGRCDPHSDIQVLPSCDVVRDDWEGDWWHNVMWYFANEHILWCGVPTVNRELVVDLPTWPSLGRSHCRSWRWSTIRQTFARVLSFQYSSQFMTQNLELSLR